jgi:hypothetical protein
MKWREVRICRKNQSIVEKRVRFGLQKLKLGYLRARKSYFLTLNV